MSVLAAPTRTLPELVNGVDQVPTRSTAPSFSVRSPLFDSNVVLPVTAAVGPVSTSVAPLFVVVDGSPRRPLTRSQVPDDSVVSTWSVPVVTRTVPVLSTRTSPVMNASPGPVALCTVPELTNRSRTPPDQPVMEEDSVIRQVPVLTTDPASPILTCTAP